MKTFVKTITFLAAAICIPIGAQTTKPPLAQQYLDGQVKMSTPFNYNGPVINLRYSTFLGKAGATPELYEKLWAQDADLINFHYLGSQRVLDSILELTRIDSENMPKDLYFDKILHRFKERDSQRANIVDIGKYEDWSKKHKKFLVFDNAATSYTSYKGKNSSNYGHAAIISFHHTKPIGFGEGGCIIIDSQYEQDLRNVLNFGIDNTSISPKWHRKAGNYKMSDIQAVYINQYLDNFKYIKDYTQSLYSYFIEEIKKEKKELYPDFSDDTPFVSCICFFSEKSNEIISLLLENKIYCRKYYKPLTDTPIAVDFYNKIVCVSCTIDMNKNDIDKILAVIKQI